MDNYRLHDSSPLIDEGNNPDLPCDEYPEIHDFTLLTGWHDPTGCQEFFNEQKIPIDFDWTIRVVNEVVDMGAYENGGEPFCDHGDCPGDFDDDGFVDSADLLVLLAAWGPCADPAPGQCPADLNCDGVVDGSDLLILLSNWGECSNPEPVFPQELLEDCYNLYGHDAGEFLACVFSSEELQSMFGEGEEEQ